MITLTVVLAIILFAVLLMYWALRGIVALLRVLVGDV